MISSVSDVYEFVNEAIRLCREQEYEDIATRLEEAMHLGSSALEIIGAIRSILIEGQPELLSVLDKDSIQEVIHFIDASYGRS